MDTSFIPLAQLEEKSLPLLASLHCSIMHTLISELGEPLVLRYYQAARAEPTVIGFCALSASDQIRGWAMGSPDPAGLNAQLMQPLSQFAREMSQLVLTRPAVFVDLLRSLASASDANRLDQGQIELTYIGVAPLAQGQGLGKAILSAFQEAARQAGYTSIALSVETDNPAAIGLYTRGGFQITRTFREGRFERHRMVFNTSFRL